MFKKQDRMLAYAYALGVFDNNYGICHELVKFLHKTRGYDIPDFFYRDGDRHFPELWKQRTRKIPLPDGKWFYNRRERIEALENILKAK